MSFIDTQTLILPVIWSLAAVVIGLICGFFAGRAYTLSSEPRRLKRDREKTMKALVKVINSTEQLNSDVSDHSTALENAESEIQQFSGDTPFEYVQDSLVQNVRKIVAANRKMENDLIASKFQLEATAQELDRSRKEARTDSLCDVANRKAADETLNFLVSQFRSKKKTFGLMLIDIDHFKRINDTFGHEAGDEVLVSVGSALKECVRKEDFVGRLGGDEFILMLVNLTEEDAEFMGTQIQSAMEHFNFSVGSKGQSTVVTLSMGLTVITTDDDAKSLYRRADEALYRAKELGRNQLSIMLNNRQQDLPASQQGDARMSASDQFSTELNPST